jgi:myosin heavy chain 6/7
MILAPALMQAEKDVKKAAGGCLDTIKLDPDLYRLGHTKARTSSILSFVNL